MLYNSEKKQSIYTINKKLDSDSESEEIIRINNEPDPKQISSNIRDWQKLIKDDTITDIDQIIEQLYALSRDDPKNIKITKALADANKYILHKSLSDRQKLSIEKHLNDNQFGTRVKMNYDKTELDEHCRILTEGHKRRREEASKAKVISKPAPKNFGNKKAPLPLPQLEEKIDPSSWL